MGRDLDREGAVFSTLAAYQSVVQVTAHPTRRLCNIPAPARLSSAERQSMRSKPTSVSAEASAPASPGLTETVNTPPPP